MNANEVEMNICVYMIWWGSGSRYSAGLLHCIDSFYFDALAFFSSSTQSDVVHYVVSLASDWLSDWKCQNSNTTTHVRCNLVGYLLLSMFYTSKKLLIKIVLGVWNSITSSSKKSENHNGGGIPRWVSKKAA